MTRCAAPPPSFKAAAVTLVLPLLG